MNSPRYAVVMDARVILSAEDRMNTLFLNSSLVNDPFGEMDQLKESVRAALHDAVERASSALHTHTGVELRPETAAIFAATGLFAAAFLLGVAFRASQMLSVCKRKRNNEMAVRIALNAPEDDRDEHEYETRSDVRAAAPGDSDAEDDTVVKKGTLRR